jgi:hypothetical protein
MRSTYPLLFLSSLIVLSGCNAAFAPPIRSGQDGAPGRDHQGELEASGDVNGFLTGGPNLSYSVTNNVAVEGGLEASPDWAIGYAGPRFTLQGRESDPKDRSLRSGPAADLGVGLGAGAGGISNTQSGKNTSPFSNAAGGSYLTIGGAYWLPYISFYARARLEQSFAQNAPPTLWWSTTGGIEVWAGPFSIFAASGAVGYDNDTIARNVNTHAEGWMPVEGGIALHFDVAHHDAPEPVAPENTVAFVQRGK